MNSKRAHRRLKCGKHEMKFRLIADFMCKQYDWISFIYVNNCCICCCLLLSAEDERPPFRLFFHFRSLVLTRSQFSFLTKISFSFHVGVVVVAIFFPMCVIHFWQRFSSCAIYISENNTCNYFKRKTIVKFKSVCLGSNTHTQYRLLFLVANEHYEYTKRTPIYFIYTQNRDKIHTRSTYNEKKKIYDSNIMGFLESQCQW